MVGFSHILNGIKYGSLFSRLLANKSIDPEEMERLKKLKEYWDFYEGYHWGGIQTDAVDGESSEVTINYCRAFINKFVSFELGSAFTINLTREVSLAVVTEDGRTLQQFLDDVWIDNERELFCTELGQSKSVTGDAWIKVTFQEPNSDELDDPFGEYPQGKISISIVPTIYVSAIYNNHNKKVLKSVTVQYLIDKEVERPSFGMFNEDTKEVLYKEVWTKDSITYYEDNYKLETIVNPYGVIPFVQINNYPVSGKTYGVSDLEDIIPLNVEMNTKKSNVSEIIDYHASPTTIVYGAKINNLEKGANKVWGGMPKDGKVENLELRGDLRAATDYTKSLKTEMCEVAGIPETVLGGTQAVSNTSGVAMQYLNLPLIEKTKVKRAHTRNGLQRVNKLIVHIAKIEGLITQPENVQVPVINESGETTYETETITNGEFFYSEVVIPDTLPKDTLMEMQLISLEMERGLESRVGAMKRLGRDDISSKLSEVDSDHKVHPEYYLRGKAQINSGVGNGQNPDELSRLETTGQNNSNAS